MSTLCAAAAVTDSMCAFIITICVNTRKKKEKKNLFDGVHIYYYY